MARFYSQIITVMGLFFLGWLPVMAIVITYDDLDQLTLVNKEEILLYLFFNCVGIWLYRLKPVDKS